jgi:hypothetical protein
MLQAAIDQTQAVVNGEVRKVAIFSLNSELSD